MNELIIKMQEMFDTPEKWNSFQELVNQNGNIQNRWWQSLQSAVYQIECTMGNPNWEIKKWGGWDIKWYVKGENENSLVIHFTGDYFRICASGHLDFAKVNELIVDQRFNPIKACFDRIDVVSQNDTIVCEYRNFSFGSSYDGRFPNHQTLSWYAGNRTNDFAKQLIEKVRKIQTPEITALFREINENCRKDMP